MINQVFSRVFIIIILLIFIGGGILAWQYFRQKSYLSKEITPKQFKALSICRALEHKDEINLCSGIVTRDVSFCKKAGFFKETCLDEVASLTKNIELCRSIKGNYHCYDSIAALTKNPTICEKESEDSDRCFERVAIFNQDISFCQNIKDEKRKTECEYMSKGDPSLCKELERKVDSIKCWGAIAIIKKDPSFCKETESLKSWCYQSVAVKTGNESICQEILNSDVPQPEYDYLMCMAFVKEDVSFCEKLSAKGDVKEECLFTLAQHISEANIYSPPFGYVRLRE